MAKSGIADLGVILSVIGALIMIIFGILRLAGQFIEGLESILGFDFSVLGTEPTMQLAGGVIAILLGIIVVWAWNSKKITQKGDYLIWGIVFIVIGIIGGSLGGLLILIGGILILLGYFL